MQHRVPIQLFGGPYDKCTASVTLLAGILVLDSPTDSAIYVYYRVDELEYGFSALESTIFPTTYEGQQEFNEAIMALPDYGLEWF